MIAAPDRPLASEMDDAPEPGTTPPKRGGGPKTAAGKESSKRNSLRHGLMAKVVLPDDLAAAVARRTAELVAEFLPRSPYESWLVGEMARATAQIDRCAALMLVDLQRCMDRAATCWDDDRRAYIEDLGARLPKDPARVARALGGTKQGCDWLLERWEGLGEVLQTNGAWDEAQRRLAFDLLGVPAELRHGSRQIPPEGDAPALAALVETHVDRLRARQENSLHALDEATRAMAAAGMAIEEDDASRRLRRCEATARRNFARALAELRRVRAEVPGGGESPATSSRPETSPAPAERPLANGAAMDFLVERARLLYPPLPESPADEPTTADDTTTETPPVPVDVAPAAELPAVAEMPTAEPPAAVERPVASPPPSRVATSKSVSLSSTSAPRNRRERRVQEKRARQAARRGAR